MIKIKSTANRKSSTQGFTLLEVMIAVSIFGLLLLYASQFMRSEIRVFDSASKQNEVQQKARIAMMHILDEVRLNKLTYFKEEGIYCYENVAAAAEASQNENDECLIFLNVGPPPPTANIIFDEVEGKLWYRKGALSRYLIADEISELTIEQDSSLVKIEITTGGNYGSEPFKLQTWIRLN